MAEATDSQLREMLGGLKGVTTNRAALVLDQARQTVLRHGVQITHEAFRDLQLYFAAHLLEQQGLIGGRLSGRSIGDISHQYARGRAMVVECWLDVYTALRTSVQGMAGRFS